MKAKSTANWAKWLYERNVLVAWDKMWSEHMRLFQRQTNYEGNGGRQNSALWGRNQEAKFFLND